MSRVKKVLPIVDDCEVARCIPWSAGDKSDNCLRAERCFRHAPVTQRPPPTLSLKISVKEVAYSEESE